MGMGERGSVLQRAKNAKASAGFAPLLEFDKPQRIVIPKRGLVARGICCFAAGNKQIPRR
jgi:hypothetical protein